MDPIQQATRDADVRLSLTVETHDPDFHKAAANGGSYLPAATLVIRNLIGSDIERDSGDLPTSPGQVLDTLREPITQFGMLALAAELPLQLCRAAGMPVSEARMEPKIDQGFVAMREALAATAGWALRALRDGEKAGWWDVTPEGFGTATVTAVPDTSGVALRDAGDGFSLMGGDEETAAQELGRLGAFLRRRNPAIAPFRSAAGIVNEAILRVGPDARLEDVTQSNVETASEAMQRLASYIIERVPGEPSRNEGVVDTVIRLLESK